MRHRVWSFRLLGLVCLGLALAIGVLGVAAFPYNTAPFLSRKGLGSLSLAQEYYGAIGAPPTFAAWYTQFFPAGGLRADATYYNAGDLGFGREMHCREQFEFTSCYVVNHGLGPGAPADIAVNDAVANTRILPTVAMVYDYTIDGQPNDVKFYVYGTDGNLLTQVALDSEGDKFVPHLCLACHGGTYSESTESVSGASFLPFDADSFAYSNVPGFTRADQEEQFRVLNYMVWNSFPNPPISALVTGWYAGSGGVTTPGAALDNDYTPPDYDGNAANRELYHEVLKHHCRGCHMAQSFDLSDPMDVDGSAFGAVFGSNDMPHAEMTAHNFWTSGAPSVLANRFTSETFRVTSTADTTPNGCDANCTLREAILAANSNADLSIITFAVDGTFSLALAGTDNTAALGDLDITADLYLLGNGALLTDLNGNAVDRYFDIQAGINVVIQGVTVRGGLAPVGGGIRNNGGFLTLNASVVRGNHASVSGGGGLTIESSGSGHINQSTISNNSTAGDGGGILNDVSLLFINNSTLSGNSSDDDGGALWSDFGSTATLRHVTVVGNYAAGAGGGLATNNGSLTNVGSSFVGGNTSNGVTDCFVSGDAAQASLGRNLLGASGGAGGCLVGGGDTLNSLALGAVVDPALTIDPISGLRYHAPRAGGPLLDAIALGANCQTPSYDTRNVARPRDANHDGVLGCDIGAVEFFALPVFLPAVSK